MKKLILIIILSLFTLSCDKYITQNIYERTYEVSELNFAYQDVYNHLEQYGLDSIPLENWIANDIYGTDTSQLEQRILRKVIDEKTNYQFIFNKYIGPKHPYYSFLIRYMGRKKDLLVQ